MLLRNKETQKIRALPEMPAAVGENAVSEIN